jgi:hypothetical protein
VSSSHDLQCRVLLTRELAECTSMDVPTPFSKLRSSLLFSSSPIAITDVLDRLSTMPKLESSSITKALGRMHTSWVRSNASWLVERPSRSEAASPTSNARIHRRLARLSSTSSRSTQRVWFPGTIPQFSGMLDTKIPPCKVPHVCRRGG